MAKKELEIDIVVNSQEVIEAQQQVDKLKGKTEELSKSVTIEYDIDGRPINVLVDSSINLTKQARAVKTELDKLTIAGLQNTEKFTLLSNKYNDINDQLGATRVRSGELFQTLSLLPGPVGTFSSRLQGAVDVIKILSQFKFADLKNQFKSLGRDLAEITKNFFGGRRAASIIGNVPSTQTTQEENIQDQIDEQKLVTDAIDKTTRATQAQTVALAAQTSVIQSQNAVLASRMEIANMSTDQFTKLNTAIQNLKKSGFETYITDLDDNLEVLTVVMEDTQGNVRQLTLEEIELAAANKRLKLDVQGNIVAFKTLGDVVTGVLVRLAAFAVITIALVKLYEGFVKLYEIISEYLTGAKKAERANEALRMSFEQLKNGINEYGDVLNAQEKMESDRIKKRYGSLQEELKNERDFYNKRVQANKEAMSKMERESIRVQANAWINGEQTKERQKEIDDEIARLSKEAGDLRIEGFQLEVNQRMRIKLKADQDYLKEVQASITKEIDSENTRKKNLEYLLNEELRMRIMMEELKGTQIENIKRENAKKVTEAIVEDNVREIQKEIDKNNRLVEETVIGTEQYFKARREIAQLQMTKEFEQAKLDESTKIQNEENARTKFYRTIKEIESEELQSILDLKQTHLNSLFEQSSDFYHAQREVEIANYALQQQLARDNYDKLEELKEEHFKRLNDINIAELRDRADMLGKLSTLEQSNFDEIQKYTIKSLFDRNNAIQTLEKKRYDDLRVQAQMNFEAEMMRSQGNNEKMLLAKLEYIQTMENLNAQEFEARKQVLLAIEQVSMEFGQTLNSIGTAIMNEAQGIDKKKFENAKKMAIAGLVVEKAAAIASIFSNTAIANAKSVAAFPLTAGQPWVTINTISAVLSTAATIAATIRAINQISSQQFEGERMTNNLGRNYEKGGLIGGKRHAEGGTIIEAEKGEAIMTRGAVTMFQPMLSMMNQLGGGAPFNNSVMGGASPDNPALNNPNTNNYTPIIKTYVVSSEMTTEMEKQARLKDLTTL